ncbi:hypothetical protein PI27_gp014 [Listeria phage WIL-1]|nr:hypothetical protein PI27_gp014 [Listeria phage WIL-1]
MFVIVIVHGFIHIAIELNNLLPR